ncbi:nuclear pore glycoprotein p62-like [Scleropages formosus]|uniref:Nuclear pore glycoprotein p62 n=1 Tax=Scleropages formosus TaxID=113540 RepID=A0A0P7VIL8_SCLFO|nr:nuclear pore glycoprotein p62-like [Scleropages formosus]
MSGFSFGQTTTAFSFSTPKTTAGAAPASGFGLTNSTPAQPGGGGFSFQTSAPTPASSSQTSSLFPLPVQGTQSTQGGFSFSTPAQTSTTGGGFSFGISTPKPATTGLTLTSMAAPSSGSGFTFGSGPTTQTSVAQPQVSTGGFSLGGLTATQPSGGFSFGVGATSTAGSAATTSAATGTVGLMLKPLGAATTTITTTTATTTAATTFSLGLKPVGTMAPIAGTATSTTTATAASAPPVMTYAQLEALINKWSLELEDQERHFLQQATQVNAWDRMLVENGEKITSLHKEMEKVKLDQRRLDQELDFILSQQKELEDLLGPLEESVKEQSGTIYMQNADEERERTYKLAENVDAQLKRMSQDLKEIIEHLNTSSGPADTSDPLQQICKILNAHMDSLQWIDQNSVLLQRRVEEVSKLCESRRKEQEKSFHINFE